MEEKKIEAVGAQAWRIYLIDPGKLIGLVVFSFAFLLLSLGGSLLLRGMAGFLFLAIGVPAIFAAFLSFFSIKKNPAFEITGYFQALFAYFQPPFRGVFRAIVSFLKTAAAFFLASTLFVLLYVSFSKGFDPNFQSAFVELSEAYQLGDLEKLANILNENESMLRFYGILYPVVYGVSALFLLHFLFVGAIEVSGRADVPKVVAEGTSIKVFSNAARSVRKLHWKQYWGACWFMPILLSAGFALGVSLSQSLSARDPYLPTLIGLASMALLYSLMLPYHAEVNRLLMERWEKQVYTEAARQMKRMLLQAEANSSIDDKTVAFFSKRIEKLENALKEGNYREVKPEEPEEENPFE